MKQSGMGERKERLVDILMYGWATSKDPDTLLLARGLPEAKLPNLSCLHMKAPGRTARPAFENQPAQKRWTIHDSCVPSGEIQLRRARPWKSRPRALKSGAVIWWRLP
ncbi:hypothetical protein [Mesorhizobium sp. M1163]|uniref:hypothetical protein n=1 Tax=Mesorhizobium sp. M1163 TaxID=2957065 RepID=UPI00333DAE63